MPTKNLRVSFLAVIALVAGVVIAIVYTGRRHESAAPLASGSATADIRATSTPGIGLRPLIVDAETLRFEPFSREWTYGTVRPLKDGSVLIANGESPHAYVVAPDGTVDGAGLPISGKVDVGISRDETRLAWADVDGIRVYDRRDSSVRTVDSATWVGGQLVWSPDASEMAMTQVTGDNVAHLEVLDLAKSSRREVFAADTAKAIQGIRWLSQHVIEFRVMDVGDLSTCCPPQGGTKYEVSDMGGFPRITGVPNVLWSACGPACGLPPGGYERLDGTVFWYESILGGTRYHWDVVDRVANVIRALPGADNSGGGSLSPDGRTMAYIICNFHDPQTLRLVRLADLSLRDFVPPTIGGGGRVCYNVSWFPSGEKILLHFGMPG